MMTTFSETEAILKSAVTLSQNSVKQISEASGIMVDTLYKWKTMRNRHLSPANADILLLYFKKNEPQTLIEAYVLNLVHNYLQDYLTSSTEEEVRKGGLNYDNL